MKFLSINIACLILILFLILSTNGHTGDSVYVNSMNISGLEYTKRSIVLRELTFNIPSLVQKVKIEEFKTRLSNLIIFKRVQTQYADSVLTIQIEEAPRYSIFPSLSLIDRSWSKINFGFNFTHFNLYGDKIYMNLNAALGYNPGFSFSLMDDWFTQKKLILGFNAYYGKIKHKLYSFKEKHRKFSIVTGKRLGRDTYFTINNGIHYFSFPEKELEFFNIKNYHTKFYQFGIVFLYDKRNYKFFPTNGHYFNAAFNSESIDPFQMQFKHYITDSRLFIPFKQMAFSFRQYSHFTSQALPIYDRVFLGYSERLRGYFFNTYSGKALLLNQMEIRFPLLKPKYYNFESIAKSAPDGYKQYFNNLLLGIYGGLFIENAMLKNYYKSLNIKDGKTGYGLSLYFLLPFHNLIRMDTAINDKGNFQFILESRVSF